MHNPKQHVILFSAPVLT